jgi:phospholipid/cholesterol/gamma-HCH transport system permease protein
MYFPYFCPPIGFHPMMVERMLTHVGRYILMLRQGISKPESFSMYYIEFVRQCYAIGVGSIIIVALISVFIGAVAAVQFSYQLGGTMVPKYYIGYILRDMSIIELSPTITCMTLAGKVGSNISAEIGGMRQKEHIDAMELMGVNTANYLIMPKIMAAVTMIPILIFMAAFLSICGGYLATVPFGLTTDAEFVRGVRAFFVPYNVVMMFVKSFVFGFIITSVSAYQGFFVKGGSIELGEASTRAVVFSNILILLSDYVIAIVLTT